MDVLTDKSKKAYSYISRYSAFPFYYNKQDDKYVYGITSQLNEDTVYVLHKIKEGDSFDSLAEHYYGRPDYYWIIADFHRVQDPLVKLFGKFKTLKIPSLSNITFKQ